MEKELNEINTKKESGFPYFWVGVGLGAIGGFLSALLALKESREYLRNEGAQSLEYLTAGRKKLWERAEDIAQKGRELISQCCSQCGAPVRSKTGNGTDEESAQP